MSEKQIMRVKKPVFVLSKPGQPSVHVSLEDSGPTPVPTPTAKQEINFDNGAEITPQEAADYYKDNPEHRLQALMAERKRKLMNSVFKGTRFDVDRKGPNGEKIPLSELMSGPGMTLQEAKMLSDRKREIIKKIQKSKLAPEVKQELIHAVDIEAQPGQPVEPLPPKKKYYQTGE